MPTIENKRQSASRNYNIYKCEMSIEAAATFSEFINQATRDINYRQILEHYESHYNLRKFKITEILADSSFSMFQHIVEKFYKNHNPGESGTWVENQLRLYLWTVICYMEIHRKTLLTMEKADWDFFSRVFFVKEYSLFEYQARILLDESIKISKWSQEEDYMLYCIIIKDKEAKWNEIAKSLFINSNKQYLRASKQCRERWLNHLDPSKSKSEWSLKEYLIMFEQVQQKGKKWALLVKILKDRRSQHSIKNKYNSIIKKQQRLSPQLNQTQICREMINKINRIMDTRQIEPNDEYLFGCSLKLLNNQQRSKEGNDKRASRVSVEEIEQYRSKFENFRKKIQKFQCPQNQPQRPKPSQPKTPKKPVFIKQFHLSMATPKSRRELEQIPEPVSQPDDEIFYDESFQVDGALRPQEFNVIFAEDFRNMISEHELDL